MAVLEMIIDQLHKEVNVHKILEDIMKKRKILNEMLLGIAVVFVVCASALSYYYFTVIVH